MSFDMVQVLPVHQERAHREGVPLSADAFFRPNSPIMPLLLDGAIFMMYQIIWIRVRVRDLVKRVQRIIIFKIKWINFELPLTVERPNHSLPSSSEGVELELACDVGQTEHLQYR